MRMLLLNARPKNAESSVWRTFEVRDTLDFSKLHLVLQTLFGYLNQEGYEFFSKKDKWRFTSDEELVNHAAYLKSKEGKAYLETIDKDKYDVDVSVDIAHAKDKTIAFYFKEDEPVTYLYDFVDEWQIELSLVDTYEGSGKARLIDGFGSAPYEAVGGLEGYLAIMEVLSNPENEGYDELRFWLYEKGYKRFDKEEVNDALKALDL